MPGEAEVGTYRVFISYSHEDLDLALRVAATLEASGLTPMWDKKFSFGQGFHDQIKTFIAHAHAFLPIITEGSSRRGWVHQEIGYAMALNIPVLPVTTGVLPGEMLQQLHALVLSSDDHELGRQLALPVFEGLLNRYDNPTLALYQCAELTEDRAMMMARYANDVLEMGARGRVRQKGALSSFHIPDRVITDPVWKRRYGGLSRSTFHCRVQREERLALTAHVREAGCRLIIDPTIGYAEYGPEARVVRLQCLADFLDSMGDDLAQVAIGRHMDEQQSLTIVGDWFAAESVSGAIGQGYRQTIFTRHAPSMQSRIDLFDQEFDGLLADTGWPAEESRSRAVRTLRDLIAELTA